LAVIVMISFRWTLSGLLKDHAVAVFSHYDTLSASEPYTTSLDSTLRRGPLAVRGAVISPVFSGQF